MGVRRKFTRLKRQHRTSYLPILQERRSRSSLLVPMSLNWKEAAVSYPPILRVILIHMLSIDLSYFLYHIFHVHVYKYFQIMLLFIFISLVVSTAHSFETTICDCSKPTGIGLLTLNRKGAVVSYSPILRVI
jgi:hypothetical protein